MRDVGKNLHRQYEITMNWNPEEDGDNTMIKICRRKQLFDLNRSLCPCSLKQLFKSSYWKIPK